MSFTNHAFRRLSQAAFLLLTTSLFLAFAPATATAQTVTTIATGLSGPRGIAADGLGNVYIGEASRISRVTPTGSFEVVVTDTSSHYGLVCDAANSVYYTVGGGVKKFTPNPAGSATPGTVTNVTSLGFNPVGVTLAPDGNLYVTKESPASIVKITPIGVSSTFAALPQTPYTITCDQAGNLYVSYKWLSGGLYNSIVSKVGTDGVVSTFATSPYGTGINGVAMDNSTGDFYFVEFGKNVVLRVAPDGTVSSFAGVSYQAVGMGIDKKSNLYVALSGTTSAAKISEPPVLSLPGNIAGVEATSPAGAAVTFTATATDRKDGFAPVTFTPASGSTLPVGTTTVSASATDSDGNVATKNFTVTVVDTTAPVISVSADGVPVVLSAMDAVANATFESPSTSSFTAAATGWTRSGDSGVTAISSMPGRFVGDAGPAGNQIAYINTGNMSQGLAATVQAGTTYVLSAYVGRRSDDPAARGSISLTTSSGTVLATASSDAAQTVGTFALVRAFYTPAVNDANIGKTLRIVLANVATQQVNFDGVTLTSFTAGTVGSDVAVAAAGPAGATVAFTATASDLVSPAVSVVASPASGSIFPLGTTRVLLSSVDAIGNAITQTFTVTVNPAVATIAFTTPPYTYDGASKSATAVVTPAGAPVTFTYNGSSNPPNNAGTYSVAAQVNQSWVTGSATGNLTIAKAVPAISVAGYSVVYDRTEHVATGSVTGVGGVSLAGLNLTGTKHTNAGTFNDTWTFTDVTGNYANTTGAVTVRIDQATATLAFVLLAQMYDGTAKSVTVTTVPAGMATTVTYNGNATAPVNAGSYAVSAAVNDANYVGTATGTLVVAKAPATIAFSNTTQTYDGSAKSVTLTTTPVGLTTMLTYGGSANPPTNAGSYPLVATITESNYTGSATDTLQVGKASASLSFANTSQTYDGAPKAVTVSTSPTGLTYSLAYNGSATAPVNAGSYVLDAAITDSNYAGTLTGSLAIAQAVQVITFNPVPGVTFGDAPFTVNATSNSGLAVAFSIVSGPATIVGNTVTITGAGPVVVRAAQPGDANYAAASNVDQSFTVGKANQAIAFGAITGVTFGDVPFALSATSDSGLPAAFSVVSGPASLSGSTLTITGAGPVVVRASQAGNVNYNPAPNVEQTFTVGKANQAITFAALGDKTYGDAAFTVSATSNSGLPVTFSVANGPATISGNTVKVTGAGTVILRASQAGDSNTNAAPNVDRTFAVGKATLAVTAKNATRVFGAADPVFAVTYAGFVGTDTAAVLTTAPVATTTATAASNVGTYPITASSGVDANYAFSYVAGSLVITPASATVALAGVNGVYSGTPQSATATTVPVGLSVGFTYNGAATAPTNAGTYTVLATITDPNYSGSASGSFTIDKAVVPVALSNLNQVFDGAPKSVTATTTPAGLTVNVTYNSSATAPTAAGSYTVVASISDLNYRGSSSATLVVAPSTAAAIVIGNLTQVYDGMPKPVTATTTPVGLPTTITYGGSTTAPTIPGTYLVVASISNPNYTATVTGNLVISVTALVRHAPTLDRDIEGSVQVLTGESLALNGNASVSGDILVPGLPTVRLNGQPTFVGTKDGTGSATPSNYQVTLNGKAVLRYLVRRIDPIAMPTVSAPPAPTGTRDVEITKAGQSLGSLTTLRNVVINDKAGTIALPAGTYGTLTADGSTAFQLGVAAATTPSVYNLQGLTMNGKSQLKVVGPVVLVLARSASIDGEVIGTGSPAWLTLGVASGGVTLNGNVSFIGTIVAPNGTVTINGNASLNGSVIADRLTVNGNGLLKQGTP